MIKQGTLPGTKVRCINPGSRDSGLQRGGIYTLVGTPSRRWTDYSHCVQLRETRNLIRRDTNDDDWGFNPDRIEIVVEDWDEPT